MEYNFQKRRNSLIAKRCTIYWSFLRISKVEFLMRSRSSKKVSAHRRLINSLVQVRFSETAAFYIAKIDEFKNNDGESSRNI